MQNRCGRVFGQGSTMINCHCDLKIIKKKTLDIPRPGLTSFGLFWVIGLLYLPLTALIPNHRNLYVPLENNYVLLSCVYSVSRSRQAVLRTSYREVLPACSATLLRPQLTFFHSKYCAQSRHFFFGSYSFVYPVFGECPLKNAFDYSKLAFRRTQNFGARLECS